MSRPARTAPVVLRRPDQVRATASPVAHQILSVMERARRCTVAELARQLGLPAGSLYYHVRKLERAGVLAVHAKRSTGGRKEVVYELTGSEVVLDPRASGPAFLAALAKSVRVRLRALERAYLDALARSPKGASRRESLSLHQHHARLGAAKRAELRRRVEDLERFLIENDDPRQPAFTHVTIAVVPIARPPR